MVAIYLIATGIVAMFGHGGAVATDINTLVGTSMSGVTMFILGLMLVVVIQAMLQLMFSVIIGRPL